MRITKASMWRGGKKTLERIRFGQIRWVSWVIQSRFVIIINIWLWMTKDEKSLETLECTAPCPWSCIIFVYFVCLLLEKRRRLREAKTPKRCVIIHNFSRADSCPFIWECSHAAYPFRHRDAWSIYMRSRRDFRSERRCYRLHRQLSNYSLSDCVFIVCWLFVGVANKSSNYFFVLCISLAIGQVREAN